MVQPTALISQDFWSLRFRLGTRTGRGSSWPFGNFLLRQVRSRRVLAGHGRSLINARFYVRVPNQEGE